MDKRKALMISEELHSEIKELAKKNGVLLNWYIERILKSHIKNDK